MGFVIITVLIFILYQAAIIGPKLPFKVQITLLIILSLSFALLHGIIANTQLSSTGFAASNREPNFTARNIGYALSVLGILNSGLSLKNMRYSAILLGVLFVTLPIMMLLSL